MMSLLITLLLGSFINELWIIFDYMGYIQFIENNFSVHTIVEKNTIIRKIHIIFILSILTLALFIYLRKSAIPHFNLLDKIGHFIIFFSLFSFLFPMFFTDFSPITLHGEDALFESLTAILAFIASILFLLSIRKKNHFTNTFMKLILFFIFFFFSMEEISWGQRIFDWETPQVFKEINAQNETNFHNFFNVYFHIFYPIFNLSLALFLFFSAYIKSKQKSYFLQRFNNFIPSTKFILFGFIFTTLIFDSYHYGGEITEVIFSIFALLYAYEIYQVSKEI